MDATRNATQLDALQGFYVGITNLQLEVLMRIHLIIVFLDFQAILHFIAFLHSFQKLPKVLKYIKASEASKVHFRNRTLIPPSQKFEKVG